MLCREILLDPGSQQTFITQRIVDELKLKPHCELSHQYEETNLKEYEIRLFPMNSNENHLIKVFIRAKNLFKNKGAKSELCYQKS